MGAAAQAALDIGLAGASQGIGIGMGMLTAPWQDRRQVRQQEKLTKVQEEANKRMADYTHGLQYDMWNKTNYGAQMEHLKAAGLNPGLIYGMSGGGGATTGSASAGGVSGGSAAGSAGEAMQGMGLGLQAGLMQAQKRLMEAQATKTEAEAAKTAGVDTQLAEGQLTKLAAETDNEKAKGELLKIEATLKDMEAYEKQESQHDRLDTIHWNTRKAVYELEMLERSNTTQKATQQAVIGEIRARAVGAVLQNALTTAQTTNTKADTALKGTQQAGIRANISLTQAQINTMAQNLMIDWDRLSIEQKKARISQELTNHSTSMDRFNEKLLLEGFDAVGDAMKPQKKVFNIYKGDY